MQFSDLISIHPLTLVPNYHVGTNVYIWNDETNSPVKFLSSEQVVTESTFSFLLENPSQSVYIHESCHRSYREYLCENLDTWLETPRIPRILKTAVLAETQHAKLKDAYDLQSIAKIFQASVESSQSLARSGLQISENGREVHRILHHDSSFVTHAINTAFYSLIIANLLGFCEETTAEICAGAMLHDIGKLDLGSANTIIDSASSMDWTLRREKLHPTEGFKMLCNEPGVKETHLMTVYQHHERHDGKGFPVGLLEEESHLASRICAVANRFDGLTSKRPHREAMTRAAALRVLDSEKKGAFDLEVMKCLERAMNQTSTN